MPEPHEHHEKPGAGDYIWIAYSFFFFIEPVVRNNPAYWLKNALIYLVFLATYITSVRTIHHTRKLALLLAMALIGLIAFPLNAGAACFLSFSTAILPFTIESTTAVVLSITLASVAIIAEGRILHLAWPDYFLSVFMMIVVGTSNIFISQKKRATSKLLRAQDEIERLAAISERERIARDLHDVLGHTLSVIVLKSELAGRLLARETSPAALPNPVSTQNPTATENPTALLNSSPIPAASPAPANLSNPNLLAALREIADVEQTARTALAEVREAIGGYRSRGLPAEIDHARQTLATAGVTLSADLPRHLTLSATQETVLSLAIREAVTNIVRHARASTASIHLSTTPAGDHTLRIADNGPSTSPRPLHEGNGLRGMRERAESLGGHLSLTPTHPGTTLDLHLPPNPSSRPERSAVEGPAFPLPRRQITPTETQPTGATRIPTSDPLPQ